MAIPLLNLIGSFGDALIGKNATNQAQKSQERAINRAGDAVTGSYNQAIGYQQPYYDMGTANARTLSSMVNNGVFNTPAYNYQMQQAPNMAFNFEQDPGYQFRMQQGTQAINSNAAAQGKQLSGATLKALAKYGQNLASQEYGNAFDRYNQNRNFAQGQYQFGTQYGMQNALNNYNAANQQANQNYNRFSDLAGMGQNAASNMANLANAYGGNMADLAIQRGNVQSRGIMGRGQAYSNMLNSGTQYLGNQFGGNGMSNLSGIAGGNAAAGSAIGSGVPVDTAMNLASLLPALA